MALPDGQAPESTDFANYFCTYAYIYHQVIRKTSPVRLVAGASRVHVQHLVPAPLLPPPAAPDESLLNSSPVACAQKDMLEDAKRTGAYYNAVMQNRAQFAGKVMDVLFAAAVPLCPTSISAWACKGGSSLADLDISLHYATRTGGAGRWLRVGGAGHFCRQGRREDGVCGGGHRHGQVRAEGRAT